MWESLEERGKERGEVRSKGEGKEEMSWNAKSADSNPDRLIQVGIG